MKIKPLLEEFAGYYKRNDTYKKVEYPVFSFPLKNDEIKVLKTNVGATLRFIAVPATKKVYIFDGMNMVHRNVIGNFGIPEDYDEMYAGTAAFVNGKITYMGSDRQTVISKFSVGRKENRKLKEYDWSFVDKYIENATTEINKAIGKQ